MGQAPVAAEAPRRTRTRLQFLSPLLQLANLLQQSLSLLHQTVFEPVEPEVTGHLFRFIVFVSIVWSSTDETSTSSHSTSSIAAAGRATQTVPPSPAASSDSSRSPAAAPSPSRTKARRHFISSSTETTRCLSGFKYRSEKRAIRARGHLER